MIRRSSLVALAIIAALGFGIFQLKYAVRALEAELAQLNRSILIEQEAIHVLGAEWSYLTRPVRIRELSGRHLRLQEMSETQVSYLEDLPIGTGQHGVAITPAMAKNEGQARADGYRQIMIRARTIQ